MAQRVEVLVVGGGPVGLTLACELHRHGVPCRIIDKNEAPQVWSKAAAMTPRTMEVLDDVGIGPAIHARGRRVLGGNLYRGSERFAHIDFSAEGTRYPFLLGISQRETEELLAEHLEQLGGRLERPLALGHFEQSDERVVATLVCPDGRREQVTARWLVGCDGAKSTVREILGLPFEGSTFEQNLIQGDVRVDFPFAVDPNEAAMFPSHEGLFGALPLLSEGRYRVILPNMPDPDADPTFEVFEKIAAARVPEGTRVYDPAWVAKFRFHGRVVPQFRVGRVFLAGDAAHVHSPVGGQGMNMGIQDAYNLAWKLALVARGKGRPLLLDSYDPERRPVAKATVEGTDFATKAMLRILALRSSLAESLRNQAASFLTSTGFFADRAFRTLGQLSVGYPASPIVGQHHASIWSTHVGGAASEEPHLTEWIAFARSTAPGERVPDVDLVSKTEGKSTLNDLLRGERHVLFLFDGAAATTEGYARLSTIADRTLARYQDVICTFVVVTHTERPAALTWGGHVVLDVDGSLHQHFGCSSEALCLVRPDGHVGFRSQPAVLEKLLGYLETIFV